MGGELIVALNDDCAEFKGVLVGCLNVNEKAGLAAVVDTGLIVRVGLSLLVATARVIQLQRGLA